jgi:hypothetical protein
LFGPSEKLPSAVTRLRWFYGGCVSPGHTRTDAAIDPATATFVGALPVCSGRPPISSVTFGAPRFGVDRFVNALVSLPVRLYRRGKRIVPPVPFDVPPDVRFLDARVPLIVRLSCDRGLCSRC